jgi:hypothetical protein
MIIPVEIKSGSRTQAKSLKSYCERYNLPLTIKLVGKAGRNIIPLFICVINLISVPSVIQTAEQIQIIYEDC